MARWCASAHIRSTTKVEESGQRTSTDDEDIPGAPPDHHPSSTNPGKTTRPPDEPLSVELEGERILYPSGDVGATSVEMGASGRDEDAVGRPKKLRNASKLVSRCPEHRSREDSPRRTQVELDDPGAKADASIASWTIKDVGKKPKKPRKPSERVSGHSKRRNRENSPGRPGEEPEDPGGEAVVPGGTHSIQERARSVRNERVDETNAPCRDRAPEGRRGEQEPSRGTEVDLGRRNVGKGAEHDRVCTRTEEDERVDDANALCRDTCPGGQMGELDQSSRSEASEGCRQRRIRQDTSEGRRRRARRRNERAKSRYAARRPRGRPDRVGRRRERP